MRVRRVLGVVAALVAMAVGPPVGAHPSQAVTAGVLSVSGGLWEPGAGPSTTNAFAMQTTSTVVGSMRASGTLTGHASQWSGHARLESGGHNLFVTLSLVGGSLTATGTGGGHTTDMNCSVQPQATGGPGPGVLYAVTAYDYNCSVMIV